jgi:hypothetical protein
MQLIRHKLAFDKNIQIATLASNYREYFNRAAASVLRQHNIICEYKGAFDAAELL